MARQRMSFREAMDLVPDDLPDGAYFAMAHEIAGIEYGEGFAELVDDRPPRPYLVPLPKGSRPIGCGKCGRRFMSKDARDQHYSAKHL